MRVPSRRLELPFEYACDTCFFVHPSHETFQISSSLAGTLVHVCMQCEALEADPLFLLEHRRTMAGMPPADWLLSHLTFVQSPNSKGGVYCEFQTLV